MQQIGFIGGGNMASSIIAGLLTTGAYQGSQIWVSSPEIDKLQALKQRYGVHISCDNHSLVEQCPQLVLAVKPQVMQDMLAPLKATLSQRQSLLISIAAGISVDALINWSGSQQIIRCMPNTPAMLGLGATGLYATAQVSADKRQLANTIMQAVGKTTWLEQEVQIDAITALSGSGPAYYFLFMEAMIDAAQTLGLDKEIATEFCIQTAKGASAMAEASELDIKTLRQQVCSPNGTTEKAIASLQQDKLEQSVSNAMQAAYARAQELGRALFKG